MATTQPPASNEILDQAAVHYLENNGLIFWDNDVVMSGDPDPAPKGTNEVWITSLFTTYVYASSNTIYKSDGVTAYLGSECPTWADVDAWASSTAPPPSYWPSKELAPQSFTVTGPQSGDPEQNYNTLNWYNHATTETRWYVEFHRSTDNVTFTHLSGQDTSVNGASMNQNAAPGRSDEVAGTLYYYKIRYKRQKADSSWDYGAFTAVVSRTAGP